MQNPVFTSQEEKIVSLSQFTYVDDMVVLSRNENWLTAFEQKLNKFFKGMLYVDHVTKPVLRTNFFSSTFKIKICNKAEIIWENVNKCK